MSSVSAETIRPLTNEVYLQNIRLAETNKTLLLLREIDKIVLSTDTDTDIVTDRMSAAVANGSDFPVVVIYLRDKSKGAFEPKAATILAGTDITRELTGAKIMKHMVSLRHSHNPMVRAAQNVFIVKSDHLFDVMSPAIPIEEAEVLQHGLGIKTFLICPLQARGEVFGAMVLGSPAPFSDLSFYTKDLLERLTVAVGIGLDNTLLYAQRQLTSQRLRTANRHLKELDRAKDEFISMASHQLRTPLTSIRGYISMLMEGDAGPLSTTQREYLDFAFGGSERMVNLISDLLNVSRMQAGKFLIHKTTVDLAAIVAEEASQLQQHANARKIKLKYVPPKKPLPKVRLDEEKTRQVIMNFIDNAIYYTHDGVVTVSLEHVGDRVEMKVTDTGIGVPISSQRKLFGKFYRAENAQTMRPDGTGLGLFLAKRVVHDQGGTIIFTSTEGKGSTFGFSIPITKPSKETHGTRKRP